MVRKIRTIGVVGAGQMGAGIAQLLATNGVKVVLCDVDLKVAEKARNVIFRSLQRQMEKGRITAAEVESSLSSIKFTDNLSHFEEVDLVIEAVFENESVKKEIFKKLDLITDKDIVLASNTSSISIAGLASVTNRPDKVIGMHFMNPAPIMAGVEIIRGLLTSDDAVQQVSELVGRLGKTAILANDRPGFIVNRILFPMLNEAIFALYEGVSTREDIDSGMKLCCNLPIGPLALADMIGLDTVLAILNTLYAGFCDTKYRACPLLKEYVDSGRLGRKSGKGFFDYGA